MLIGDDGQHDPDLYAEVVAATPERVRAVLIRQLTAVEQVLTHGTTEPPTERRGATERPAHQDLRAPDGAGLLAALQANGLLPVG
jgi:phosphatidate phosphatase APP1